jgi:hypothetical protein
MTDPRALSDEAVHHLDRLGAVILDDVGDGPPPQDLAASAAAARDAIGQMGVAALTQLASLVAGVADSMVAGTTDWSPSLGGTLMAAVDDLRHLVGRASHFSDEDSEHLHHRAAELSVYVTTSWSTGDEAQAQSAQAQSAQAQGVSPEPQAEPDPEPEVQPEPQPGSTHPVSLSEPMDPARTAQDPSLALKMTGSSPIVPISDLFYADQGPHVVSGGMPEKVAAKSELLGRGIDALENLTAQLLAKPLAVGPMAVVPVETLLYRGRAALERAAAIREQIKAAGGQAAPAALDEMYDLIGLALKD